MSPRAHRVELQLLTETQRPYVRPKRGSHVSVEENKATVWRAYDSAMHHHDFETARACFDAAFVLHSPLFPEPLDLDAYEAQIRNSLRVLKDLKVTFEDSIGEGDRVVVRHVFRWTHTAEFMGAAPNGKSVEVRGTDVYRFSGGKIVEEWGLADTLGLLRQIGALPPIGS
jgi:predicted ester cyclase